MRVAYYLMDPEPNLVNVALNRCRALCGQAFARLVVPAPGGGGGDGRGARTRRWGLGFIWSFRAFLRDHRKSQVYWQCHNTCKPGASVSSATVLQGFLLGGLPLRVLSFLLGLPQ